ncbi:hypothetical protein [Pseudomonas chlororaphis]|uniref:hypothetical protein n=1 Tax=Pseudomonas chlororaphis TaxID=587753 RepID=UPI000F5704ED|nr:hypothetical protein [Pseudomonas chlororaphis]AZE14361.1 hypothetical protein C4K10_6126 [Pseudomonas chlororaphis subsp. aureofaciens]
MATDTINTSSGTFKKVATVQSSPTKELIPKSVVVEQGLTVFLGGAGMIGGYNADMINAFTEIGIANSVYGNYSSLITGADEYVHPMVDMLADASAVIFYNQDSSRPAESEYDQLGVVKERTDLYGLVAVKSTMPVIESQPADFSLAAIGISKKIPTSGQFNIVGYSWGAVIAARSAMYHARKDIIVDHLVLIGAPINQDLKDAVTGHPKIIKTIIIDLTDKGDPIYAGMTDAELVGVAPELAGQMSGTNQGHFYYSGDDADGQLRHRELAKRLYDEGLR